MEAITFAYKMSHGKGQGVVYFLTNCVCFDWQFVSEHEIILTVVRYVPM